MDELKKKYEELKNKPENELDAFEQEALEGLEKTDLNRASLTKNFYDIQFLNKYGSKRKFKISILYFSAAALMLLSLMVWLWRFYVTHDSTKEFLTIKNQTKNDVGTHPILSSSDEKSSEDENAISLNKNIEKTNRELNSRFIEKYDLKAHQGSSISKDDQPQYNSNVEEAAVPSEQKKISGYGSSPEPNVMANTEEQKISSREMAATPTADAEYYTPQKSLNRSKIKKNNIKIKGDWYMFHDKENLISDLDQLADKYHLELKEIEIKEKNEVIIIHLSELTFDHQSNSFMKELEDIIKKNLTNERLNKKIEIINKP